MVRFVADGNGDKACLLHVGRIHAHDLKSLCRFMLGQPMGESADILHKHSPPVIGPKYSSDGPRYLMYADPYRANWRQMLGDNSTARIPCVPWNSSPPFSQRAQILLKLFMLSPDTLSLLFGRGNQSPEPLLQQAVKQTNGSTCASGYCAWLQRALPIDSVSFLPHFLLPKSNGRRQDGAGQ